MELVTLCLLDKEINMPNGNVHTTWDSENNNWKNQREGASRASSRHETKAGATDRGQDLARNSESEWLGHKKDGTINERNTYGKDPFPPKG